MKRLLLALVVFAALPLAAETITGVVKDDTGAVIPGVTITAGGSVAVTDTDGTFRIADLKPGAHTIEAVLDGFQPISKSVKLGTGQTVEVAFKLVPAFGETVEVTADAVQTGEVAILETRRQSAVVSDSISSEEIRKTPDSTAAGVVERLTGVTLSATNTSSSAASASVTAARPSTARRCPPPKPKSASCRSTSFPRVSSRP